MSCNYHFLFQSFKRKWYPCCIFSCLLLLMLNLHFMLSTSLGLLWSLDYLHVSLIKQLIRRQCGVWFLYFCRLEQELDDFQGLVYPQNDPDAVTITQKDIRILDPSEFLNDTIIDFYIKWVLLLISDLLRVVLKYKVLKHGIEKSAMHLQHKHW